MAGREGEWWGGEGKGRRREERKGSIDFLRIMREGRITVSVGVTHPPHILI